MRYRFLVTMIFMGNIEGGAEVFISEGVTSAAPIYSHPRFLYFAGVLSLQLLSFNQLV